MASITELIKRAAVEAVNASKPAQVVFGQVVNISPLKVRISEKIVLEKSNLVVPEHLTEHDVYMEHDELDYEGKKVHRRYLYTVKAALSYGDKVVMIRDQGGQKYLIIDRTEDGK